MMAAFDNEYPGEPDEQRYETQATLMDATMPSLGGVPSIAREIVRRGEQAGSRARCRPAVPGRDR